MGLGSQRATIVHHYYTPQFRACTPQSPLENTTQRNFHVTMFESPTMKNATFSDPRWTPGYRVRLDEMEE
jgi:hypothetical protein